MEMWLKRSTLVFFAAAAVLVISGQAPVILDKTHRERVEVPVGSSVTFYCGLMTETYERFRVVWHINTSGSSINCSCSLPCTSAKPTNNLSNKKNQRNTDETLLRYTLSNATAQDSGWYFCKVISEIPVLSCNISSGREVVITKSEENPTYPSLPIVTATATPTNSQPIDWWMWIMLAGSAFVLIVLLVICVWLKRRCRRNRGEEPIYANTHNKQPSPRPGSQPVDKLKPVSSSQNLRNPSPGRKYNDGNRRYK